MAGLKLCESCFKKSSGAVAFRKDALLIYQQQVTSMERTKRLPKTPPSTLKQNVAENLLDSVEKLKRQLNAKNLKPAGVWRQSSVNLKIEALIQTVYLTMAKQDPKAQSKIHHHVPVILVILTGRFIQIMTIVLSVRNRKPKTVMNFGDPYLLLIQSQCPTTLRSWTLS